MAATVLSQPAPEFWRACLGLVAEISVGCLHRAWHHACPAQNGPADDSAENADNQGVGNKSFHARNLAHFR